MKIGQENLRLVYVSFLIRFYRNITYSYKRSELKRNIVILLAVVLFKNLKEGI